MTVTDSIQQLLDRLQSATHPAAVFGAFDTADELARAYRRAAKLCHPDLHPAHAEAAQDSFIQLTRWYEVARRQLGTDPHTASPAVAPILLRHKHHTYQVDPAVAFAGDFANLYRATELSTASTVALKIARQSRDNDLLIAERTALHRIAAQTDPAYHAYFPRLLDAFSHADVSTHDTRTRATNVLTWIGGAYTLDELRRAYPTGIDAKDVVWIWRRLLVALGAAHRTGIVHGAVLPPHVCVLPKEHGLVLIGWSCAVETGSLIPAISEPYEHYYPKEVMSKQPTTPATDVAMAARCMLFLLGIKLEDAPAALGRFFRGCMLPHPRQRPQDAWALLREFDELLARLWGRRTFHPFSVPAPCPR